MGDSSEWIDWDHALIQALQTIEDYTDDSGILAWEREDEAVEIDAIKKVHKFKAAVDRATTGSEKHPYKAQPGEYFIPDLWSRRKDANGKEVIQTYDEWMEKEAKKNEPLLVE